MPANDSTMSDSIISHSTKNQDIQDYGLKMRRSLRSAVVQCTERGLVMSARWAAEQLLGFDRSALHSQLHTTEPSSDNPAFSDIQPNPFTVQTQQSIPENQQSVTYLADPVTSLDEPGVEDDIYLYAKSCFDAREYPHAAEILKDCTGRRSIFLHLYAKLMAAESTQPIETYQSPKDTPSQATRRILISIEHELTAKLSKDESDGFLWYLLGVVTKKLGKREQSIRFLTKAVQKYPYNWSAWIELASQVHVQEDLDLVLQQLPNDFMTGCFQVYVENIMEYQVETNPDEIDRLLNLCPRSRFLKLQRAILFYNARDAETAESIFDELLDRNPYMIDGIQILSNVLFLRNKAGALMNLAHRLSSMYKYRAESAVVLGNYYSLIQESSNAVKSFDRALKLDRNNSDAWTLLAHEYVEQKDAPPAIQIYRRAVDLNCRNYRAWFGLGQAYDLLNLPMFSLNYYQRALAIRPKDSRMWNALAMTYESLNKIPEAIKCGLHMLISPEHNTSTTLQTISNWYSKLYIQTGNTQYQSKSALYELRAMRAREADDQDMD
ncbi:hypothetical protein BATDEDRAFT_35311 [Batrachochytrium dendrobatidis JAM81]|uniref:Cdc23 domain-containing protein n=1 Tax=Batrachochytrium dendrobatidis (strain JAM81 / FGSC 10211) TaxID=684364 RepID=F4P4Z4_BATDJ|nr:anaphase promoting complex subunit CDC23 [Batrachochytrium dendrobatidis JAM81]EGF79784.1 hypothetical protein BATDEDRAFT_35311 [Batrachochytrium dendrobatidis JAM81]KAJ8323155.1 Anaphase-promoting complex subunit 8, variant 4 [Batrachochytrium dendrobatidis]KAK5672863.1 Anaphase-promoting complex subunit 8 [Batrachochytrium dendrobatidis]|eukprot:XP_006679575.1 hypothetical protein BATDEDRAFT_35311 [Batrachochytrium dendrobatidis JAM81]